jgi:hypothetical protein
MIIENILYGEREQSVGRREAVEDKGSSMRCKEKLSIKKRAISFEYHSYPPEVP